MHSTSLFLLADWAHLLGQSWTELNCELGVHLADCGWHQNRKYLLELLWASSEMSEMSEMSGKYNVTLHSSVHYLFMTQFQVKLQPRLVIL